MASGGDEDIIVDEEIRSPNQDTNEDKSAKKPKVADDQDDILICSVAIGARREPTMLETTMSNVRRSSGNLYVLNETT